MFRHRQTLRRWAAQVLLLWLFGLVSGVVHACVLPVPEHCHEVDAAALDEGTAVPLGVVAKSNCADFCDKAHLSIPISKAALDDALAHALPPPAVRPMVPGPAYAPDRPWLPHREAAHPPPVAIAFLRLTL